MEFQTILSNYNAKSLIEPEIFRIFQHKVERIPHFARVSEVRYIYHSLSTFPVSVIEHYHSEQSVRKNTIRAVCLCFAYTLHNPQGHGLSTSYTM